MNILVSILIPAFNAEAWIGAAINSAMQQTWQKREVIVVDDGSSDSTLQIAKAFESESVKVVSQEGGGASAARNRALSLAQGEYMQWLDADNILAVDKISRQLNCRKAVENRKILLSSAWGRFFHRPRRATFTPTGLWEDLTPLEWICRKLGRNIYMVPECWLVSRELTDTAGPWNEQLSLDDDGEYFSRVMKASDMIKFCPDAVSYYRWGNTGSLSSVVTRPEKKIASQFASMCSQISDLLALENSERTRACCLTYLQRSLIYFYPERTDIMEDAHRIARELDGTLTPPDLSWKYSIIKNMFGWEIAKKICFRVPTFKLIIRKHLDRMLQDIIGSYCYS